MKINAQDVERILRICKAMRVAEEPLRVLTAVSWPFETRQKFLDQKAKELPEPSYDPIDLFASRQALKSAEMLITKHPVDQWLAGICEKLSFTQSMLDARGKPEFLRFSKLLYGDPDSPLVDEVSTSLGLARELSATFEKTVHTTFNHPAEACMLSSVAIDIMKKASEKILGEDSPRIELSEHLTANAVAGPKVVKLKTNACFSERDIAQLIHHEIGIHVTTFANGAKQQLAILGASHAGTTKTQEGLAVFAELISGSIDVARMQRLADRVIAIKMAIDGADFIQVYRYFLEQTKGREEEAYELTRRVFRGGVIAGGAPFTKDVVYLDGLLRVHNFLRSAIANGRVDCVQLLFCGKLDIDDLPILSHLSAHKLIEPPRYLPKWIQDPGFLVAYMAYSNFLNQVKLGHIRQHYQSMLHGMPPCFPN